MVDEHCNGRVWSLKVLEKIIFFLWLIGKEALPTNENRNRHHLSVTLACAICGGVVENLDHLFQKCRNVKRLWERIAPSTI